MHKHTISFLNAARGIWTALTTQANIRIHFVIGSLVLFSSVYLRVSIQEMLIIILTIMIVVIAEMLNTSLEFMSDAITLEHSIYIKHAKDVSAGAVLLSALFAVIIGALIFIPKLLAL